MKAENVLLVPGDDGCMNAKLADFGLSKLVKRGSKQRGFGDIK